MQTLKTAGVEVLNGTLIVNTRGHSMYNKMYNVSYEVKDGVITLTGEKPDYEIFIFGLEPPKDLSVFCDEDLYMARDWPFFWRKVLAVRRSRWVEYKKRKPKKYTSNTYTIIE